MRALTFWDVQDLRYETVPDPVIEKPTEAIVKVKAVGICGSDISRYRKLGPYVPGTVWGHEFSGEVIQAGDAVTNVKVGDRVVGSPAMVCNECEPCRSGMPSQCVDLSAIGAYVPGGFAEYIKVPSANLVRMGDTMSFEEGTLVEPSTVVLHGLYRTRLQMGYEVGVIGCGNIGLLSIAWAKLFGAKRVYAFDIDDAQLEAARRFGADVTINTADKDFHEEIHKHCDGVDLAIESAGTPYTSARVLGLAKRAGEVLYLGIPYGDVNSPRFYFEKILRNELTVYGSWSCVSGPYPGKEWFNAVDLIGQRKVSIEEMITHRVNLSDGPEIFKSIVQSHQGFGKVLLYPEESR
ncbi:galactitol-1-phosphate 5-dehydrogenase [Streptomyces sp. YIM S03343]